MKLNSWNLPKIIFNWLLYSGELNGRSNTLSVYKINFIFSNTFSDSLCLTIYGVQNIRSLINCFWSDSTNSPSLEVPNFSLKQLSMNSIWWPMLQIYIFHLVTSLKPISATVWCNSPVQSLKKIDDSNFVLRQ